MTLAHVNHCGKIPHATKAKALSHARALAARRGERVKAYLCSCGSWHVGHQPHERRTTKVMRADRVAAPKPKARHAR